MIRELKTAGHRELMHSIYTSAPCHSGCELMAVGSCVFASLHVVLIRTDIDSILQLGRAVCTL